MSGRVYQLKAARTRALNKKHAGTAKHAATAKHTPTAVKKAGTAHAQKARRTAAQVKAAHVSAWSPGGVSCCSAEALAASLRVLGQPVSNADVLALYQRTADSPDAGASIVATLDAAYRWGLAGVRPVSFTPVAVDDPLAVLLGLDLPEGPHAVAAGDDGVWSWGGLYELTTDAVIEEAWAVTWPC